MKKFTRKLMSVALSEQIGGIQVVLGRYADVTMLRRVVLSCKQSNSIMDAIERDDLVSLYITGEVSHAVEQMVDILCHTLSADQLETLKNTRVLVTFEGLRTGLQYKPISYAGRKMGRVDDAATGLAALIGESILRVRGGVPVRVVGIHDTADDTHYISIINQVNGQKDVLSSGGVQDFAFHGDSDGALLNAIDDFLIVGQIPSEYFEPTYFSDASLTLHNMLCDPDRSYLIEILRRPLFSASLPSYVLEADGEQVAVASYSVPVLRTDGSVAIHPTTRPIGAISPSEMALAEEALEYLRDELASHAIGVQLAPFQIAVVPNKFVKHAVGAKKLDQNGLTRRQFVRLYGTRTLRQPGKHFVTQPTV